MQEEISLREIIEVLWKGKAIIIVITITAILISGILSFFVISPKFEAKSLVRFQIDEEAYFNSVSETIQSDVTINKVIKLLELDKRGYTINELRNAITVKPIQNSRVIEIKVKGGDRTSITEIANLIAFQIGARAEISDRSNEIITAQNELLKVNDRIHVANMELKSAQDILAETPEKLVTTKSLSTEAFLQSIVAESSNISSQDASALKLVDEIINPVHTSLRQKISEIQLMLANLISSKENLESQIVMNKEAISNLDIQIDNEKLQTQNSERLLSGFNAVFITPSLQPEVPVEPNKLLNVALASVLGLGLGVIIVLAKYYWNNTNNMSEKKTRNNIS